MTNKDTVQCYYCKTPVRKDEVVRYKHKSASGNIYNRNFHEKCYHIWIANYHGFSEVRSKLLKIFNIKKLSPAIVKDIRLLRQAGYEYKLILAAIQKKEGALYRGMTKGWRYCYAIIENTVIQLHSTSTRDGSLYENEDSKLLNQSNEIINAKIYEEKSKEMKKNAIDITKYFV